MKGQIIGGEFGKVLMRQKAGQDVELGELLVAPTKEGKVLMQVFDLFFGSQLSGHHLELISGMQMEEDIPVTFFDEELRNYQLAKLKILLSLNETAKVAKTLPTFFSPVDEATKDDLSFLTKPEHPLFIGHLRSGSKVVDTDIFLEGEKVFSHHILIPATTGRGKSNLTSTMLWHVVDQDYCGILVLDPHDEYYGRNGEGLKDHPSAKDKVEYYTPHNAPPGAYTLTFNLSLLRPNHFDGAANWTTPQREALSAYYKRYRDEWIEAIILEKPVAGNFFEGTLGVVRRRVMKLLNLTFSNNKLDCHGIFQIGAGESTVSDIVSSLERGKEVVIDTSSFSGSEEILIGSIISSEIFRRYQRYKVRGELEHKPVISIVLEEAPRVLGKAVLDRGPNIFSTIAREGRKFKVGLTAITQLPSLIPRDILANMNTKIILGIEMAPERQAIIDSAAQDLSEDSRTIASLDKGEAIITSNFSRFATPVKIPFFPDIVKGAQKERPKQRFPGMQP